MSKVGDLTKSRNNWRVKSIQRRVSLEAEKRKSQKWKQRALQAEQERDDLQRQLQENSRLSPAVSTSARPNVFVLQIQVLSIFIFLIGRVSTRSVPRILNAVNETLNTCIDRIPHHTSVIHWICRAGLGLLETVQKTNKPFAAIIDTSICYSKQKLLVVLRAPLDHFSHSKRAMSLSDVECIGLILREEWNGESVCQALKEVFAKSGNPQLIIKDGGSDIGRGVKLWQDAQTSCQTEVCQDVGHVVGNALKGEYSQSRGMNIFLKVVNRARKKLCQNELVGFRPPKLRTKGRYQSISRLADWATGILDKIGPQGAAPRGSIKFKLRIAVLGLSYLRPFTLFSRLSRDKCTHEMPQDLWADSKNIQSL